MKTMAISEFKAKCISALKEVQRTREPLVVTLRGKPLARVQPAHHGPSGKRLGGLKGRMKIRREIARIDSSRDWEMLG